MGDEPQVFRGQGDLRWLPALMAERQIKAHGVLHVGAHLGEEVPIYRECGFTHATLVEPDPVTAMQLQAAHPDAEVLALAVATGASGLRGWSRKTNTHQSGLAALPAGSDLVWRGPSVHVATLDTIRGKVPIDTNVLVVDTSGTELDVLFSGVLGGYDLIIVETDDSGAHAASTSAVRSYLAAQGFEPVQRWTHGDHSYGDEAYVRVS